MMGISSNRLGGGLQRKIAHIGSFDKIVSLENLFLAWQEFRRGKRVKPDVQVFEYSLEQNIFALHELLVNGGYKHGRYHQFCVNDPKPRLISKACVTDRLLHHAIYRVLYPLFDTGFIYDSYSCRNNKGTHKAFQRMADFSRTISQNYTRDCWALKLDVRWFFDSVDHAVLIGLLEEKIADKQLLDLLIKVINSFEIRPHPPSSREATEGHGNPLLGGEGEKRGMPLGNLTSQLFANIYLDPLDKFINHELKAKYYLRYADDFMILDVKPNHLLEYLSEIDALLKDKLKLGLHKGKVSLRKLKWGIDFVGYVALPHYNLPRRKTVKRIRKRVDNLICSGGMDLLNGSLSSYLGYLKHANAYLISVKIVSDVCKARSFMLY